MFEHIMKAIGYLIISLVLILVIGLSYIMIINPYSVVPQSFSPTEAVVATLVPILASLSIIAILILRRIGEK